MSSIDKNKSSSVTVAEFLEASRHSLGLELVAGEKGLNTKIIEAAINRPGLALTGFYEYFSYKRIQTLGLAELKYLASLSEAEREKSLENFFASKIPCVILARNKKPLAGMEELSEKYKVPIMRTNMVTKHFVNAATIVMENLVAPQAKIQGTMVELMGIGVLVEGRPGIGKSDTALNLVKRGAAIVSDDITKLRVDSLSGSVIGSAIDVTRYHMEIKGVGIIHVPSLYGVASVRGEQVLNLIVSLCHEDEVEKGFNPDHEMATRDVLGVQIPNVKIAVIPGRDIASVVEVATLDYKLRLLGHDAAKELDGKLMDAMIGGR